MTDTWTTAEAIALCREIEAICPAFGCHIALTGGLLYKEGLAGQRAGPARRPRPRRRWSAAGDRRADQDGLESAPPAHP